MDREMDSILREAEGRYPRPDEARRIATIASTVERRLAACAELEATEQAIVSQTTRQVLQMYPALKERHLAEEKTARDLSLTLRYIGHAILRNDEEFFREKILYWLQGVLASKSFGEIVRGTYDIMKRVVQKEMSPTHAPEVVRFVDVCLASCRTPQERAGVSA